MRLFDVTIRVALDTSRTPKDMPDSDRAAEWANEIGEAAIVAAREEFSSPIPLASIEANVTEVFA